MKIGDKITAKRAIFSPKGAILTVGDEYTIFDIQEGYFLIKNDRCNYHSFNKSTFDKYFENEDINTSKEQRMEFKGTKGIWSYETTKKGHCKISAYNWFNFCKVYTTTDGTDWKEVTQANAKLICAAPDLLEALQVYLNAGSKEQRRDASVIAKKAIEKALG